MLIDLPVHVRNMYTYLPNVLMCCRPNLKIVRLFVIHDYAPTAHGLTSRRDSYRLGTSNS